MPVVTAFSLCRAMGQLPLTHSGGVDIHSGLRSLHCVCPSLPVLLGATLPLGVGQSPDF